jgi:hypothetical protein
LDRFLWRGKSTNFPFCTFPSPQFCTELSDHEQLYKACFCEARLVSAFYDSARGREWHDIGCDLCTQTCNDRNCEACIFCGSGDEAQAHSLHQRHLSGQAAQCQFRHIRQGQRKWSEATSNSPCLDHSEAHRNQTYQHQAKYALACILTIHFHPFHAFLFYFINLRLVL